MAIHPIQPTLGGAAVRSPLATMNDPVTLGVPRHEFRVVLGTTKIDYDPNKDKENRRKHGYSLESAVYLLQRLLVPASNPRPHLVSDSFLENNEVRHMHITEDDNGNLVLMVTTMRGDETVRVISLRKANEKESRIYHDNS